MAEPPPAPSGDDRAHVLLVYLFANKSLLESDVLGQKIMRIFLRLVVRKEESLDNTLTMFAVIIPTENVFIRN